MTDNNIDYCIDINNVSKVFTKSLINRRAYSSIKSAVTGIFSRKQELPADVQQNVAIKNLTIRIPRGSSVGVIGRNGSGKSTLLKLITGIYKPTSGKINVNGRVAALIELGAGFHPDFTGRENLELGAVLQGLSKKELEKRFDQIVEFAELQDVINEPVKTYSSGMFMRLGFSLAIHTDPDILLVDEVLAVGDAGFVAKCKEKISEIRKTGKTLLLVSHDLDAVGRWCDEVVWIKEGEVADRGHPRRVIDHYLEYIERGEEQQLITEAQSRVEEVTQGTAETKSENTLSAAERWGSREVEITRVRLLSASGDEHLLFHSHDRLTIEISYQVNDPSAAAELIFGIGINRNDGVNIFGSNTEIEKVELPREFSTEGKILIKIDNLNLLTGHYYLDVAAHKRDGYSYDYHKNHLQFAVHSALKQVGVVSLKPSWEFV